MGRLFGLPPVIAPFPHPPFPHSKKGSVPGAHIPGTLPFLIKTRQGASLSVDRTRRSPVSRPAISCDAS